MEASEDYESSGIIILDFFYSDSPPSLLEIYDAPKLWPPGSKGVIVSRLLTPPSLLAIYEIINYDADISGFFACAISRPLPPNSSHAAQSGS